MTRVAMFVSAVRLWRNLKMTPQPSLQVLQSTLIRRTVNAGLSQGAALLMIRRMQAMCTLLCVALLNSILGGQNQHQPPGNSKAVEKSHKGESCMFNPETGEVPDCVHVQADGSLAIASRYLKDLPYSSDGLAAVWIAGQWAYVNRRGVAIITGVPSYDNGPDEFHDGLVRFIKDKKYGFADRKGEAIIRPIYDGALPFENGRAKVCLGCVNKCSDRDCEHHMFSGGHWFSISEQGTVLK